MLKLILHNYHLKLNWFIYCSQGVPWPQPSEPYQPYDSRRDLLPGGSLPFCCLYNFPQTSELVVWPHSSHFKSMSNKALINDTERWTRPQDTNKSQLFSQQKKNKNQNNKQARHKAIQRKHHIVSIILNCKSKCLCNIWAFEISSVQVIQMKSTKSWMVSFTSTMQTVCSSSE